MKFYHLAPLVIAAYYVPTPFVTVRTNAMAPAFYRGDILFTVKTDDLHANDVIVFEADSAKREPYPITHRIIRKQLNETGHFEYLTKGDALMMHDGYGQLYRHWLSKEKIQGRVRGILPYIGYPIVLISDWFLCVTLTVIIVLVMWWGAVLKRKDK